MVALDPVAKEAPRMLDQAHRGDAKIRMTAGKGIGMMDAIVTGGITVMTVYKMIVVVANMVTIGKTM